MVRFLYFLRLFVGGDVPIIAGSCVKSVTYQQEEEVKHNTAKETIENKRKTARGKYICL
jgi:hypothetical protein